MSIPPDKDGQPDESLFGLPALVPGRRLKEAWRQLDDALEELEAKEHTIARLQQDLSETLQATPQNTEVDSLQIGVLVSEVARERVHWLWPGRLALGKLTLLDGDPGLGKTTLLFDLAARLTTGRPMPDGSTTNPGGVLILSTEDGLADTIRPRLEAAGADLARCLIVPSIPEADGTPRMPLLPQDLPHLEQAARRNGVRLVIVDPLMAHLDGGTNTYRDQDVRRVLAEVSAFAERYGLAVTLVRHLNKSGGTNALYRGGGSIGIIGAARIGLLVGRDPEEEQRLVLACTKNNLAPMPASLAFRIEPAPGDLSTSRIAWEGSTPLRAQDLLFESGRGSIPAIDEATAWLEEMLAEGPRPAAELYEKASAVGFAKRVLQKARSRVADTERLGGISGQGYWQWQLRRPRPSAKMPKAPFPQTGHLRNLSENGSDSEEPADTSPMPRQDSRVASPDGGHLSASKAGRIPEGGPKMPKAPFPKTGHLRNLRKDSAASAEPDEDPGYAQSIPDPDREVDKSAPSEQGHLSEPGEGGSAVGSAKVPKAPFPNTGHLRDLRDLSTPNASHTSHPIQSSLVEAQPNGEVLRSGRWVKTPRGEGRILQVFAHRVTVHVGEQAVSFPPDQITILPPPTPP